MTDQVIITTGQVIIALIAAAPALLVGIITLVKLGAFRHTVSKDVAVVQTGVEAVHEELNSRLTEWKEETRRAAVDAAIAAYAAGKAEEKDKQQAEQPKSPQ